MSTEIRLEDILHITDINNFDHICPSKISCLFNINRHFEKNKNSHRRSDHLYCVQNRNDVIVQRYKRKEKQDLRSKSFTMNFHRHKHREQPIENVVEPFVYMFDEKIW